MNRKLPIQPLYVIAAAVVVTLLMVTSAIVDVVQSRRELSHLMTEGATSLIEAIAQSSINSILSSQEIEQLLTGRLLNNAPLLAHLDSATAPSSQQLGQFAATNNIFRRNISNACGEKTLNSFQLHTEHAGLTAKYEAKDFFPPPPRGKSRPTNCFAAARHHRGEKLRREGCPIYHNDSRECAIHFESKNH